MADSRAETLAARDTLAVMEHIYARALDLADKESLVPLGHAAAGHGGAAAAPFVHEARVNLAQQNVVGPTRMRFFKRLVLRASRLFTHRLVASSEALASGVERLEAELAQVRAELAATRHDMTVRVEQGLLPQMVSIELQVNEALDSLAKEMKQAAESLATQLEGHRAEAKQVAESLGTQFEEQWTAQEGDVAGLARRLDGLEQTVGQDRSELHRVRASLAQVSRRTSLGEPARPASAAGDQPSAIEQQMYMDFELRFRGSRDEVMARQRDALRFVGEFVDSPYPLVDLGCGRGEWLELLKELGVQAYGVDSNEEMIAEVRGRGLEGVVGDAIEHLEAVAPSSLLAVSGFHIAEHMPISDLGRLVDAALLALRPGGLLLLETPNPTNLAVGAAAFYLDPTHLRPLHPQFLTFLLESHGFSEVETHFVHPLREDAAVAAEGDGPASAVDRLIAAGNWALFGPQDFIVAARRHEVTV